MDETMIALDRIASIMTPRRTACRCGGRCATCRRRRMRRIGFPQGFDGLEAAKRRRRRKTATTFVRAPGKPARGGTTKRAARPPELRNWGGWSKPVTLAQIQAAQRQARQGKRIADPVMRRMLAQGGQVYRVTRANVDRDRALTIGMTRRTGSIAGRLGQHYTSPTRGDRQVYDAIHSLPPDQIYVQAGLMSDRKPHNRLTKLYENWLQVRERPLLYNPDTTTFDEAAFGHRRGCGCGCGSM